MTAHVIDISFFTFLIICVYTDIRFRKVFNFVSLSAVILGLGLNFIDSGVPGMFYSLKGMIAGLLILFPFYLLGGFGAGDIKFIGAAGCIKGWNFTVFGGLYGAVIGGVAAVIVLIIKKRFVSTLINVFTSLYCALTFRTHQSLEFDKSQSIYLPYTAFLALGMLIRWLELQATT